MPHVDVDIGLDDSGHVLVSAKLSDDRWELNVRARASEFLTLRDIGTTDWNSRRVVKVGTSAGANVFWCSDGDAVTIMIGHDDETWDLALSVPVGLVNNLVRQVKDL